MHNLSNENASRDAQAVLSKITPTVARCSDISGHDPALLAAIHQKNGCRIDLINVPADGTLDGLDTAGWPSRVAEKLVASGVPQDQIRIITNPQEIAPSDVVLGLNSFSRSRNVKNIGSILGRVCKPGTQLFVDIQSGSGGFKYFKKIGDTQVVHSTESDARKVQRTLVTMKNEPVPSVADQGSWSTIAADLVGDGGFYREKGQHSFTYIPRGDVLCVTFDNLDVAMTKRDDRRPWGYSFIEAQEWSMLGVMAKGWTWYRDPWVVEEFEALADAGFFRQFKQVIFYGASMGGYAALVFSSVCPGADVVAFSPQSTLDKTIVPWETRYKAAWHYDYSGRFGDAARTTRTARQVFLFYDPYMPLDRGHIRRLTGDNLVHLRFPFFGHRLGSMLQQMGILKSLVTSAVYGNLTEELFFDELKARKGFRRYRMELVQRLISKQHPSLAAKVCKLSLQGGDDRFFRNILTTLTAGTE